MKIIYGSMVIVLLVLIGRLLSDDGGLSEYYHLQGRVEELETNLAQQREINLELEQQVYSLKNDAMAIESIARQTLGMTKSNETFYMVIERATTEDSQD